MKRQTIFDSVEQMLDPNALSALLGREIRQVTRLPFVVPHRSANELYEIQTSGEGGTARLILKEFQPERDWVMRLTHDTLTREAMLFTHGIYERMPQEITVPVIAAARHGATWATLMHDISAELVLLNVVLPEDVAVTLIEHLAALHAHFWNEAALDDATLGLSSLRDFVTILSSARVQNELDVGQTQPVMQLAARGWQQFAVTAPPDVCEIIGALQQDPAPLLAYLAQMPQTLVHGDYKTANLGISRVEIPSTFVLDWQDAARGPGVLDLGYLLVLNSRWLPFSQERAIEIYTDALQARGCKVSRRDIEIGILAGGALRLLWLMVSSGQDLNWLYESIRRAGKVLGYA